MQNDTTINNEMVFDENTHTYTRNNNNYISVTTLLNKYHISPDYGNIPTAVLQKAAMRGTSVHKALETYVLTQTNQGLCEEVDQFENYIKQHNIDLNSAIPERLIYDDTYLIAGTLDLCYYDDNGVFTIADHKTTSTVHFDSVTWQLNLYNFILCKGDLVQYYTTNLKTFHYYKGKFDVVECPNIDYDTVKALLETNLQNLPTFTPPQLGLQPLSNSETTILEQLIDSLELVEQERKRLNILIDKYKDVIYKNFVNNKQQSWDFSSFKANLVKGKTLSKIDKVKLETYLNTQQKSINDFMITTTGKETISIKKK